VLPLRGRRRGHPGQHPAAALPQQADGTLALADIAGAIKPIDPHFARTRLLCLENTWNGQPLTLDYLDAATALARQHGLATHLDGARLFNAAVATAAGGDPYAAARRIVAEFDWSRSASARAWAPRWARCCAAPRR
jgi:threonine aldolase